MIALHVGIGERGKQLALAGQHVEALRHYREAMQQATRVEAPEVFLRHYTQCALESLERLGALDEVLTTCGRAREHYRQHPPGDAIARKDQSSFLEREGIVQLRLQRLDEARACFTEAIAAVRPARAPLAETLLGWLRASLHVAPARLERELTRQKYWSVRTEAVRAEWALALPDVSATSH